MRQGSPIAPLLVRQSLQGCDRLGRPKLILEECKECQSTRLQAWSRPDTATLA